MNESETKSEGLKDLPKPTDNGAPKPEQQTGQVQAGQGPAQAEAPKAIETPAVETTPATEANKGQSGELPQGNETLSKDSGTLEKPLVQRDEKGRLLPGSKLNPEGMKEGTLHFKTLLKNAIKEVGGKTKDGRPAQYDEIIVKKMLTMAGEGNLKAIDMVLDRVDGKPTQAIDLTSKGERVGTVAITPERQAELDNLFALNKPEIACGIEDPKVRCKIPECATCKNKPAYEPSPSTTNNSGQAKAA